MCQTLTDTNTKNIILRAPHAITTFDSSNWVVKLKGLMLEWRWGEHADILINALEAVDRKLYPAFYETEASSEEVSKLLESIPEDHDALLLSYSDDKGLIIATCNEQMPGCEIVCYGDPDGHLDYVFERLTPRKPGNFVLDRERWQASGMGSTKNSMYECAECKEAGIVHEIVKIPGPPARGNEVSHKGDATTYDQCTGCKAVTGPWVPAPY